VEAAGFGVVLTLAGLATLATLVPYAFSSLALARMQWAERGHVPARQLIGALAVTLLALAYSIWAIVGSGGDAILFDGTTLTIPD